jgi:hypothetical protein
MKRFRLAVVAAFATAAVAASSASATVYGIDNVGSIIGPTDTIDWSQLGSPGASFTTSQAVTSGLGASATVSSAGNLLQVREQGVDWNGDFASGTVVMWDDSTADVTKGGPDITIHFAQPVAAVGAQIQADFPGAFTAQIIGSNGSPVGSFIENGDSTHLGDGSAIFIGLQSTAVDISEVQFTLTSASLHPNDFAIGPVTFGSTPLTVFPGVPEPSTWAMMLAGFAMIGAVLRGLILSERRLAGLDSAPEA